MERSSASAAVVSAMIRSHYSRLANKENSGVAIGERESQSTRINVNRSPARDATFSTVDKTIEPHVNRSRAPVRAEKISYNRRVSSNQRHVSNHVSGREQGVVRENEVSRSNANRRRRRVGPGEGAPAAKRVASNQFSGRHSDQHFARGSRNNPFTSKVVGHGRQNVSGMCSSELFFNCHITVL